MDFRATLKTFHSKVEQKQFLAAEFTVVIYFAPGKSWENFKESSTKAQSPQGEEEVGHVSQGIESNPTRKASMTVIEKMHNFLSIRHTKR